jgi:LysM repeat protein
MNFDYCEGKIHIIEAGDTLYSISRQHKVPLALLLRANPYVDVYNLQIGDELCVPIPMTMPGIEKPVPPKPEEVVPYTEYTTKEGDTIQTLLDEFDLTLEDLLKFNSLDEMYLQPGKTLKIRKPKTNRI